MLKEVEYTLDGTNYSIKQLPLAKSQEVLVRLLKLLGGGEATEAALISLPSKLTVADIDFLRDRLLGENCSYQNENGNWVPLGRAITETHFAGHIGKMFHILGKCLMVNFSDFLADLRLDDLAADVAPVE
jgi:hypothetical protein